MSSHFYANFVQRIYGVLMVNCRMSKELYAPALGFIMSSIAIRLSIDDFALAFQRPLTISIGFVAQYVLKPALGVLVARAFRICPMFCAGFVLMSWVAGAQLSSYASFLRRGDVALSILLTSSTTIASVIVQGLRLVGPVLTFHVVAFILGYWISKVPLLRQNEEACGTISLCTGMQSSTLAWVLAAQFLGSSSQAVPAAFSVVAMAIMGLCLASFWGCGSPRASCAVYRLQSSLSEEVALIG